MATDPGSPDDYNGARSPCYSMEGALCRFMYCVRALDDDPVLRFVIVDFSELKGYEVSAVSNGERALATFTKRQFV